MREFCTLFDSNYLFKFLAMHESLVRSGAEFRITAFCFDDLAHQVLGELELDHVGRVSLDQLERHDPALAGVKSDRSPVEYCWTATPALPLYVLETRPEVDEITYLDADLLFFADPEPLFEEMGDSSVLITPHRFSPEYLEQEKNGIYNVQFLTFRRDSRGMECLRWWHDRCIEWCYYRLEDGKLGDQKYLDDWPTRFDGIHVLQHKGGGLAPWNISQYELTRSGDQVLVDGEQLVFFHYHRVRLIEGGGTDWRPPGYLITREQRRLVYDPYMAALKSARRRVGKVAPGFDAGLVPRPSVRERLHRLKEDARTTLSRQRDRSFSGAGNDG